MLLGIDESGRGPVIGDLVVAGVLLPSWHHQQALREKGVRDSKSLSRKKRELLFPVICDMATRIIAKRVSAEEIDSWRSLGVSLNELEAKLFAEVIAEARPSGVVVDCADVRPDAFLSRMRRYSKLPKDVVCEHRADQTYPVVSAASIVAKVLRDRSIGELSSKYGPVGSGYCSDPKTIEFLERWFEKTGGFPHFTRTTWSTCLRISREAGSTVRPRKTQD